MTGPTEQQTKKSKFGKSSLIGLIGSGGIFLLDHNPTAATVLAFPPGINPRAFFAGRSLPYLGWLLHIRLWFVLSGSHDVSQLNPTADTRRFVLEIFDGLIDS